MKRIVTVTVDHADDAKYVGDLIKRVGAGNTDAMCDLADCYLRPSHGLGRDTTKGMSLLQKAVEGNNTKAMVKLADSYCALTTSKVHMVSAFQQALIEGIDNTEAMVKLSDRYYGVTDDKAKAASLLEQAVNGNNTDAMVKLAEGYLEHWYIYDLAKDTTKGVSLLQQAVGGNNTKAMVKLADGYLVPKYGLTQDKEKAMSLLQQAVDCGSSHAKRAMDLINKAGAGDTNAMYDLAHCYLDPQGCFFKEFTKGVSLLQVAVDRNNPKAMVALAEGYLKPRFGLTKDDAKGVSLLHQAIDCGSTEAMSRLAFCYLIGTHGVDKDLRKAEHWFLAADTSYGLFSVGKAYERDHDMDKAVQVWTMAADMGNDDAKCSLGWCYQNGVGVEYNQRKAVSLYSNSESWALGVCYLMGEGVPRDWAKAVSLFNQSADSKYGKAFLGWCHLWGCGVERDVAKGVHLLSQSTDLTCNLFQECCIGHTFLGYCHETGLGVEMDLNKASALFDQCCQGDEAKWVGELGVFCQRGDCGAPMDKELAVKYFRIASAGGDPVSMFHLGVCFRDGDGVACDMDRSRRWLMEADLFGHRGAAKILHPPEMQVQQDNVVEALKQQIQSLQKSVLDLTNENRELRNTNVQLGNQCSHTEKTLAQERISVVNLNRCLKEEVDRSASLQEIINTMASLISATSSDFRVEKLLGTGSNAAAFKVQYITPFDNNSISSGAHTTSTSTPSSSTEATVMTMATTKRGRDMVMKVLFNWENTPQQTMLRQKYMAECATLSLVPNHPNVIHPLGAIVAPFLPAEFVEKIPRDKPFFREMCNYKSLLILMPHAGITLSAFLSPFMSSNNKRALEIALSLFLQGTKAIQHLESHSIVHRDIKQDNILVDPESGKLTLIDFGEAQQCCPPNMEMMITATTQSWGNTGTMPPELSMFLKATTASTRVPSRGSHALFSFSKCDSFALALTFWDALIPPQSRKFIGSTMNQDMSQFNTKSLLDHFPVPLFSTHGAPAKEAPPKPKWKSRLQSFPFSLFSSLSSSPTQQPPGTAAAPVQVAANPLGELMQRVMIEMMKTRLPGFQPPNCGLAISVKGMTTTNTPRVVWLSKIVWEWVMPWLVPQSPPTATSMSRAMDTKHAVTMFGVGEGVFPLVGLVSSSLLRHYASHHLAIDAAAEAGATSCVNWLIANRRAAKQQQQQRRDEGEAGECEGIVGPGSVWTSRNKEVIWVLGGLCCGGHLEMAQRLVDGTWPGGGFTWSENPIVMGGGGGTDECGISDHVRDAGILKRVCKNGHMDVARWIVERFNIREPWEVVGPFRGAVSKGHLALAQWLFNTFHLGECVFRDQEVSCSVHLKAYRSENLEVVKWCFEAFPREEPIYGLFSDYGTGKKSSSVDICKFITERMSGTGSLFKTVHRVDVLKWATSFTSAIPTSVARFCKGKGGLELVRYAVEEYSIKPTPDDFIAACKTKSKEGVALVRWLSTKVTLSPSDLGNSLTVALARDNTAIATWLDETFNIMKRLSAWNSAPGVLLLKVCKATKYYHERVKGVEWIMSFPEMGCVEESLVVRAVNKLVNRGLSTTPLLLMEKFTISEPTRTNLLLGILKESIQSDGITQAKKIISMGDFTKSSVARCLTNAVGLRSTKAVKWLIMHFQLDRGHITTYKNKILLRMMEQGKESCAEWLIKKFHVTLEEVLDLPFNLDPGNKFDLFMWEMIVRQFRGTITGTKIKQRLFPVILHSPFIALSAIRLFPDLTMDYIITLCQSTTPFDLTLDTRCWFRHCYNHH